LFPAGDLDQGRPPRDRSPSRTKGADCKPKKLSDAEVEAAFLEWYAAYPRKEAPKDARRAYARILRSGEATIPQLLAALRAYRFAPAPLKGEKDYRPHPATWLNGGRWQEVAVGKDGAGTDPGLTAGWWHKNPAIVPKLGTADWQILVGASARNGAWPVEMLGPPPGDPGCLIPRGILKKLNLEKGTLPNA
jgi:hypothetical protein